MPNLSPAEWSLIAAALCAAAEVATGTFILLGLATGCLAVALLYALTTPTTPTIPTALFVTVSALSIYTLRHTFARPGDSRQAEGDVNDY